MIWNAQSIRPKFLEFFYVLWLKSVLVSMVSETHLKDDDSFYGSDFSTFRLDRGDGRRGGGVALFISKRLKHKLLPVPATQVVEAVAAEVWLSNRWLIFVSIYFPGSDDPQVLRKFRADIRLLMSLGSNVIIGGDFNSRHTFCFKK